MLIFDQNLKIPVLTVKHLFKYWRKNIFVTNLPKMEYLLAKNLKGVSDHLGIWHVKRFCGGLKKNPENNVLVRGPLHCENGLLKSENICILFCPLQIFEKMQQFWCILCHVSYHTIMYDTVPCIFIACKPTYPREHQAKTRWCIYGHHTWPCVPDPPQTYQQS